MTTSNALLLASCRVALTAFLHDLGKFAERARIPEAQQIMTDGKNTRQAVHEGIYCPTYNHRPTHIHAAYTAIALELLENYLPAWIGDNMEPFAPRSSRDADDSMINAAAKHHRPDSFLQWIIASADRLASGFERETFDTYNAAPDDEKIKLNHYTTRQWTLLKSIRLNAKPGNQPQHRPAYRYALEPLSPGAIIPVQAEKSGETDNNTTAQDQYKKLWNAFIAGMQSIPPAHRNHLPLWLGKFMAHLYPCHSLGHGGHWRRSATQCLAIRSF